MATGDIIQKYGAATAMTWTSGGPTSLANGSDTSLTDALDLTALSAIDILLFLKATTAAGTLATTPQLRLFAAPSRDNASYPVASSSFLRIVGAHTFQAAAVAENSQAFGLAAHFGGVLPPYCKFLLGNASGLVLGSGGTDTQLFYVPVFANVSP